MNEMHYSLVISKDKQKIFWQKKTCQAAYLWKTVQYKVAKLLCLNIYTAAKVQHHPTVISEQFFKKDLKGQLILCYPSLSLVCQMHQNAI